MREPRVKWNQQISGTSGTQTLWHYQSCLCSFLEQYICGNSYFWADNSNNLRTSGNATHIWALHLEQLLARKHLYQRLKMLPLSLTAPSAELNNFSPSNTPSKESLTLTSSVLLLKKLKVLSLRLSLTQRRIRWSRRWRPHKARDGIRSADSVLVNAIKELS